MPVLWFISTVETDMSDKILFKTTKHPKQAAERLRDLLADLQCAIPPSFHFLDGTAYTLDHDDWSSLEHSCKLGGAPSLLDEDCTIEEFDARRARQVQRIAAYCARFGVSLDAADLIERWQPSACRPDESASAYVRRFEWQQCNMDREVLRIAGEIRRSGAVPNEAGVELLRQGLRCSRPEVRNWLETDVGPIAIRLIEDHDHRFADRGYRLLDTLQAIDSDFSYGRVTMAKALAHGWGTPARLKPKDRLIRARNLLAGLEKELTDTTWLNDESFIEYYLTFWFVLTQEGPTRDVPKALKMAKRGADYGNAPCARELFRAYRADQHPLYKGEVTPAPALAEGYRAQALLAGMDEVTELFEGEVA